MNVAWLATYGFVIGVALIFAWIAIPSWLRELRGSGTYRAFRAWIGYPLPEPVHEPLGDLIAATMRNYGEAFASSVTQHNTLYAYMNKYQPTAPCVRDVVRWDEAVTEMETAAHEEALRKALRNERRRDLGLGTGE